MKSVLAVAGSVALLVSMAPAEAAQNGAQARAGTPTTVLSFASLNPETCNHGPLPIMSIAQPPAHGTVTFQKFEHVVAKGPCAGKAVRSMATIYRSNPGYHGPDAFAVDAQTEIYVNGVGMRTSRFPVTVEVK